MDYILNRRLGSLNNNDGILSFPYYGGLKGRFLNLNRDGKANAELSSRRQYAEGRAHFDDHFNKIQEAAARLVAIQEIAKQKGAFSQEDNKLYANSLFELGVAAQNLAQLQQNGEIQDFSKLLQGSNTQVLIKPSNVAPTNPYVDASNQTEGSFVPVSQDDPYEDFGDSISVNAPKKDASVAEAKPIGLSIAGEGGVASSKPNAVAIAGREGLAVASPKATAIAGVSPEEAAAFSVNVPSRNQIIIKSKYLQPQENSAPEIRSSASKRIPSHLIYETKGKTAATVDDFDDAEEIARVNSSTTATKNDNYQNVRSGKPSSSKTPILSNDFIAYPNISV